MAAGFAVVLLATLSLSGALVPPSLTTQPGLEDDYDEIDFPRPVAPELSYWSHNGIINSTGRPYTAHIGKLDYGLPLSFSFELPTGGCCHRSKTTETAKLHGCTYATNAGFFSTTSGCCVGNLISNGSTVQLNGINRVNFGLLESKFLSGYVSNETLQKGSLKFRQLITGAGWLLRKGEVAVDKSMQLEGLSEIFVKEKAPRTAIGVYANASLVLVQVDGQEDIKAGVDLYEFAELLLEMGLQQAVNLDGGGSSVSAYQGRVISRPTCIDNSLVCEREVSSIACMHV